MKSIQNFILESSAIDNLSNKLYDKFKQYGEFENIKEIVYNSAEKYGENTAFIIKHKEEKNITYSFYSNILSGVSMKSLKGGTKLK